MHGVDAAGLQYDISVHDDADSRIEQQIPRALDHRCSYAGRLQCLACLAREYRCTFEGDAFGQYDRVSGFGAGCEDGSIFVHFAQQGTYGNWTRQVQRDLSVAPDESDSQVIAGVCDLFEYGCGLLRSGALRQKQRGHKPFGSCAHNRKVVGVDLDQVPADQVGRKRDRVGLGHQVAVSEVDQRRVFAELGAEHDSRIADLYPTKQISQKIVGQLACLQAQGAPSQELGGR